MRVHAETRKKIDLLSGPAGKSRISAKANGLTVAEPYAPNALYAQSPYVTVQLSATDASACRTSQFSTNQKNSHDQFKAKDA